MSENTLKTQETLGNTLRNTVCTWKSVSESLRHAKFHMEKGAETNRRLEFRENKCKSRAELVKTTETKKP